MKLLSFANDKRKGRKGEGEVTLLVSAEASARVEYDKKAIFSSFLKKIGSRVPHPQRKGEGKKGNKKLGNSGGVGGRKVKNLPSFRKGETRTSIEDYKRPCLVGVRGAGKGPDLFPFR